MRIGGLMKNHDNLTGGLAGIYFGFSNIPRRWYCALRGTADVDILWKRVLTEKREMIIKCDRFY